LANSIFVLTTHSINIIFRQKSHDTCEREATVSKHRISIQNMKMMQFATKLQIPNTVTLIDLFK